MIFLTFHNGFHPRSVILWYLPDLHHLVADIADGAIIIDLIPVSVVAEDIKGISFVQCKQDIAVIFFVRGASDVGASNIHTTMCGICWLWCSRAVTKGDIFLLDISVQVIAVSTVGADIVPFADAALYR